MAEEMTYVLYEAPAMRELGSFEDVTQAIASGSHIDGNYSQGTPSNGHVLS